jgi:hypothetical protein
MPRPHTARLDTLARNAGDQRDRPSHELITTVSTMLTKRLVASGKWNEKFFPCQEKSPGSRPNPSR